jgi:hypothetical protein
MIGLIIHIVRFVCSKSSAYFSMVNLQRLSLPTGDISAKELTSLNLPWTFQRAGKKTSVENWKSYGTFPLNYPLFVLSPSCSYIFVPVLF